MKKKFFISILILTLLISIVLLVSATQWNDDEAVVAETNEAVREIPPQRVLDAHASLLELAGLFMDTRG